MKQYPGHANVHVRGWSDYINVWPAANADIYFAWGFRYCDVHVLRRCKENVVHNVVFF